MRTKPPLLFLLALLAAAPPAHGAALQVRARSRLDVTPRFAGDGALAVAGRLADDRGRAIGAEVVQVAVAGCAEHTAQTGDDGAFAVRFPPSETDACGRPDGSVQLDVWFGGSSRYGPARWGKTIDPRRALVDLALSVTPPDVAVGEAVGLAAELRVDGEPLAGAPVTFDVADGVVGEARSDERGRASLSWEPAPEGPRGALVARARFAGTLRLNAAEDERPLRVYGVPTLTVDARVAGPDLVVGGGLADRSGAPLPGAVLTLLLDGRPVRSLVTDEAGGFSLRTPMRRLTEELPGRRVWLSLRFEPADPAWGPVRSDEVPLAVPVPPTIPLPTYLWLLVALAALLGALGPGVTGARRLAAVLRSALRDGRRRPTATLGEGVLVPSLPPGGAAAGDRWLVRARLWDVDRDGPVARAAAALVTADGAVAEAESDAEGWVTFAARTAGPARLRVDLPRFEPVAPGFELPHDGTLDGVTVRLVTCRLAALDDWRRFLDGRLPGGAGWGRRTPRQALTVLAPDPRGPAGADGVVAGFERLYYGNPAEPRPALEALRRAVGAVVGRPSPAGRQPGEREAGR